MIATITLILFIAGLAIGLTYAIYTFPKREIKRLYKEFTVNKKLNEGEFIHLTEKIDHNFRLIVKPNCETLYSSTFLTDIGSSFLLKIPPVQYYFGVTFINEHNDVLGYITNADLNKNEITSIQITFDGSGFSKKAGQVKLKAKACWIIVRYGSNEKGNLDNARQLQNEIQLTRV